MRNEEREVPKKCSIAILACYPGWAVCWVCWRTVLGGVGEPTDVTVHPQQRAEGKDVIDLVKDVDAEWSRRCKKLGSLSPKLAGHLGYRAQGSGLRGAPEE